MNKLSLSLLMVVWFVGGMFMSYILTEHFDVVPTRKAAYDEGYNLGFNKGQNYSRDLDRGEPRFADSLTVYTAVYCEPTFLRKQVCLVKHAGSMGSLQFIKLPVDDPAIKPGQKFRVSYDPVHIYLQFPK